jgi:glycosyltransferase involved in cell wall biosynthesis
VLPGNPSNVQASAPSLCFVIAEPAGPISRHAGSVAAILARHGWKVHVLVAGQATRDDRRLAAEWTRDGVGYTWLQDLSFPPELTVAGPNQFPALARSEEVRHALAELHRRHRLDLIEFPDRGGLGLRTVQAHQAGLDFDGVRLAVTLHEASACAREANAQWPAGPADLAADFCERHAFERAAHQLALSPSGLQRAAGLGWDIRPDARILPTAGPDAVAAFYAPLLAPVLAARPLTQPPPVTVAVPHYNLGAYLPAALASLAAQTYPNLEVVVIDDGSTELGSRRTFEHLRGQYPAFRFLKQDNAGPGAARNRALAEARGRYFLPMDADNVARPDMIERLVRGLEGNPDLAALSSYFLAFAEDADIPAKRFAYSYRPVGGPHVLASLWNVYGDGNALFRTPALRAVGGFETDRGFSWEDWDVFIKLVNAGFAVDVLPAHLFYYRHRAASFSRLTDGHRNQQRLLRRFVEGGPLPPAERLALWNALAGFQRRLEQLEGENHALRRRLATSAHRFADGVLGILGHVRRSLQPSRAGRQRG